VWGCGSAPLTQLTVREMSDRMRVLNLIASPPSGRPYVVGHPIQPKVWEADWSAVDGGDSGIRHVERRWAAAAAAWATVPVQHAMVAVLPGSARG